MNDTLEVKRIAIYLSIAFGISWTVGLYIYLTGGLTESPTLVPGMGLTRTFLLLALVYMPAPAIAHVLTRLVTNEGWQNTGLRPNFRRRWPSWLAAWVGPAILTIAGAAIYFLLFPQQFDPSLSTLKRIRDAAAEQTGQEVPLPLATLALIQALQAIVLAPIINGLFTFGEEFGWRAYLQPKLLALGWRKAMPAMGVIWGVWHWPIVAMGHNYGLDYPGAPWTGLLTMVWFTFVVGTFLGWLTVRGGSVWPAVIGHAALNGIAGLPLFFAHGTPNPLVGPLPLGIVGSLGFTVAALWMFLNEPDRAAAIEPLTHSAT